MDELLRGIGEWIGSISNHSTGITVTIQISPLSVHPSPWTPLRAHYHLNHDETGAQHWFVLVAEDGSISGDEDDGGSSWSVGYLDPNADRYPNTPAL